MDQIPQPKNNQSENKNNAPLATSPAQPVSSVSSIPDNASKSEINTNTQNNGQQFKLASTEVQGPKPPLVSGKGSKFALIAIVLILIIIAGIGGYYFYTKDNSLPSASSPAAILPTATPAADKNLDTDKDGLLDEIEKILGTYVTKADTDSDGYNDLQEIKNGYSPIIAGKAGKYTAEEWDNMKGKIKIEDSEFYDREFGTLPISFQSPSPAPAVSLTPSPATSQAPISFTCGTSIVKDTDNNTYNTVKIGEQCWLKENLKVTKNSAGVLITRYCYGDDYKNCDTDGGLYDWNTTMNKSTAESAQGICLAGWHVPKDSEWYVLENKFAGNHSERGIERFEESFSSFNFFKTDLLNRDVSFWSSTETNDTIASMFTIIESVHGTYRTLIDDKYKTDKYSIRCLKD